MQIVDDNKDNNVANGRTEALPPLFGCCRPPGRRTGTMVLFTKLLLFSVDAHNFTPNKKARLVVFGSFAPVIFWILLV
jgi:hypothetical protein